MRYENGLNGQTGASQFVPLLPREDLISHKLAPKLAQQLKVGLTKITNMNNILYIVYHNIL